MYSLGNGLANIWHHPINQWWPRSPSPYDVIKPQWVGALSYVCRIQWNSVTAITLRTQGGNQCKILINEARLNTVGFQGFRVGLGLLRFLYEKLTMICNFKLMQIIQKYLCKNRYTFLISIIYVLVQKGSNSSAWTHWSYISFALTHSSYHIRYDVKCAKLQ